MACATMSLEAHGEVCPSQRWPNSPVSQLDSAARVRFIQAGLAEGRDQTRFWANAWGATWIAVTAGQLGASVLVADDDKDKYRVGAASSALGLIPTWILGPRIVAAAPFFSSDASCISLARAEGELELDAENDEFKTGAFPYAATVAVNLAKSLVLAYGLNHGHDAVLAFAVGVPVGALMPLTYPRAAARLRAKYVAGEVAEARSSTWERISIAGMPVGGGAGALIGFGF